MEKNILFFLMFISERERERQSMSRGGAEREGDTALSCQHRAHCGAQIHEPINGEIMT